MRDIYTVDVRTHGDADSIREALVQQLVKPVRWTETIRAMRRRRRTRDRRMRPGPRADGLNRRIEKNKEIAMLAIEDARIAAAGACRHARSNA